MGESSKNERKFEECYSGLAEHCGNNLLDTYPDSSVCPARE